MAGSVRPFSVRHEFLAEWAKFKSQTPGSTQCHELVLVRCPDQSPFWPKDRLKGVSRIDLLR